METRISQSLLFSVKSYEKSESCRQVQILQTIPRPRAVPHHSGEIRSNATNRNPKFPRKEDASPVANVGTIGSNTKFGLEDSNRVSGATRNARQTVLDCVINKIPLFISAAVSKRKSCQVSDEFRENRERYSFPSQAFRFVFSLPKSPLLIL
jgi:hypothetical protein